MSLARKFKSSSKSANEGINITLEDCINTDGTIPTFKVRRNSMQNKLYAKAIMELNDKALAKYGVTSIDQLTPEQNEAEDLGVFIDAVLVGWENVELEDGIKFPYSKENAITLFSDPDWYDLMIKIKVGASSVKGFSADLVSKITKN